MSRAFQETAGDSLPVVQLRVFRQLEGSTHFVRLLSSSYGGCFTHWARGNSQYCAGKECLWKCNTSPKDWKGYGAADVYDVKQKLWIPYCFELTASMELDFRDRWKRGGFWKVSWPHSRKGHHDPKRGEWIRQLPLDGLPEDFAIIPCLLNVYHVFDMDLTTPNPMPPRTMVQANTGFDPTECGTSLPVLTPDQIAAEVKSLSEQFEFRRNRPAPSANGTAKHP
jgi:hypothetical protein